MERLWENEIKECSLCGKKFTGFGHNPAPLKHYELRCCDTCNDTKVIPARLKRMGIKSK